MGKRHRHKVGKGHRGTGHQSQCLVVLSVGHPSVRAPGHVLPCSSIGGIVDGVHDRGLVGLSVGTGTSREIEGCTARGEECQGVIEGHAQHDDTVCVHRRVLRRVDGDGHRSRLCLRGYFQLCAEGVQRKVFEVGHRLTGEIVGLTSCRYGNVHVHLISIEHVVFEEIVAGKVVCLGSHIVDAYECGGVSVGNAQDVVGDMLRLHARSRHPNLHSVLS